MSDIMNQIQLKLDEKGRGTFYYEENGEQVGEMVVSVDRNNVAVYHTEVNPEMEGKGIAHALLDKMTEYARNHHLKVIPFCPYVHAQFKRHPELYNDIWNR
ncbi:MAG TPA: GNAT family N-acetyltransferase [Flavisolibacter sp.]|nr:GNAT family N-acetyltransferase [Flavisolibacter sp.]